MSICTLNFTRTLAKKLCTLPETSFAPSNGVCIFLAIDTLLGVNPLLLCYKSNRHFNVISSVIASL